MVLVLGLPAPCPAWVSIRNQDRCLALVGRLEGRRKLKTVGWHHPIIMISGGN